MSEQRPPSRRRRPVPDARLLLGIGLVIASVIGTVTLIESADRRATVYVAASTIAPGQPIDPDDLRARRVALDDAVGLYLSANDLPGDGLVATTVIRQGELVPRSSLGTAAGTQSTSIVLNLTGEVSASVTAGALVDVWASSSDPGSAVDDPESAPTTFGAFGPPIVLSADAVVVRVLEPDGIVSAADGSSVEVLVPRIQIARLLHAIANGDALAVVPAGIPLGDR